MSPNDLCGECKKQLVYKHSGDDDSTKSSPGSAAFKRVEEVSKHATGSSAMIAASAAVLLFHEREPTGDYENLRLAARRAMHHRRRPSKK